MIYILAIAFVLLVYALFEYTWFKTVRLKSSDFKSGDFNLKGKRIVFLSDFQYDHKFMGFRHYAAKKLIRNVNAMKPDLILLGGDLIHKNNGHCGKIFKYLKELEAPIITVLGNHDYRLLSFVLEECKKANIIVLRDEVYNFEGINIIGFDRTWMHDNRVFDYSTQSPNIALSHSPDFIVENEIQADIMLSGHLHGGQVSLFGLYSPITNSHYGQDYLRGLKPVKNSKLYITTGLGGYVFFLPIRFFTRPEIVVLED